MTTADFIRTNLNVDVRQLALQKPPAGIDIAFALRQIEGAQLARRKLPTWAATDGIIYPPRLALEQCSSEATAAYKRQILETGITAKGGESRQWSLADITGGLGIDFAAMAPLFATATYVERQQQLAEAASHNITLILSRADTTTPPCTTHLTFVNAEAETWLQANSADVIYIDPARRDAAGRKVALVEDCQPDVGTLHDDIVSHCRIALIKLSPMLDIRAAMRALPSATDIHVVSLNGECKEILFMLNGASGSPTIHCAMLAQAAGDAGAMPGPVQTRVFTFTPTEEAAAQLLVADDVEDFIYEPDAAILKAGAFKLVCQRYPVRKLAANTHLYTASRHITDFPGRAWRLTGKSSFNKRELKAFTAGIRTAEIGVRGFPATVATLRRQLRLADGPDAHLIATTLGDGSHRLLRVEPLNGRPTPQD